MSIDEACLIIQEAITVGNKSYGPNTFALELSSIDKEDAPAGHWYRADLGYMVTGDWENTIQEALIALAKRVK